MMLKKKDYKRFYIGFVFILVTFHFSIFTLLAVERGPIVSLEPTEIKDFDQNPEPVRKILLHALELATQNLSYIYGSADLAKGGLDCSGTVYYILTQAGFKNVPRSSSEQYKWVRQAGLFRAVNSTDPATFELEEIRPGDLMFWVGTYDIERDPPITHIMFYLGRLKKDNRHVMIGASDGRTYESIQRFGVSVFDFKLPGFPVPKQRRENSSRFIGYGSVPGLKNLDLQE